MSMGSEELDAIKERLKKVREDIGLIKDDLIALKKKLEEKAVEEFKKKLDDDF